MSALNIVDSDLFKDGLSVAVRTLGQIPDDIDVIIADGNGLFENSRV